MRARNKIKYILIIVFIIVICLTCIRIIFSQNVNLRQINRFTIPFVAKTNNHILYDGYAVGMAVSDSFVYVIDLSDTTITKGFCYDYRGKRIFFPFQTKPTYAKPYNENFINYLPSSKRLAIIDKDNQRVNFYTEKGAFINSRNINVSNGQINLILDIAEYGDLLYYIIASAKQGSKSFIINLYSQLNNNEIKLEKRMEPYTGNKIIGLPDKKMLIDSYGNNMIAFAEIDRQNISILLYEHGQKNSINIRRNLIRLPWQNMRFPVQITLGNKYLVLGYASKDLVYPHKQIVYNMSGHCIGKLKFKDDVKNELVDIVGDKVVAFNPISSVVTVFKISVENSK